MKDTIHLPLGIDKIITIGKMTFKFVYKVVKTVALVGIWVSSGIGLEVVGPCIPDLKVRLGLNYEEISRAFIGPSLSFVLGSVLGGLVHQKSPMLGPLFFALGNVIAAVGITLIPWMPSLWSLGLMLFLSVWGIGMSNPGGNALILRLWGKKHSGPPMFALHFGFGLGALLAPQVARPFISPMDLIHNVSDSSENKTLNVTEESHQYASFDSLNHTRCDVNLSKCTSEELPENPLIIYPFIIAGAVFLLAALPFLAFQFIDCVGLKSENRDKEGEDMTTGRLCSISACAGEDSVYGIIMLCLLFLYYMQVVGGEHIYGNWIYSFALETDTGFTKDQATMLVSLYWFCFMSGRGIGVILSKFIHVTYLLVVDMTGFLITSLILSTWGHKEPVVLWIVTAAMGFFVARLFPSGLLWANLHLRVNPITLTICTIGASTGHLVYVYLGGFFLEYFGTRSVMLLEVMCGVLILGMFLLMQMTTKIHYRHMRQSVTLNKEMASLQQDICDDELGTSDDNNVTGVIYTPKSYRKIRGLV